MANLEDLVTDICLRDPETVADETGTWGLLLDDGHSEVIAPEGLLASEVHDRLPDRR